MALVVASYLVAPDRASRSALARPSDAGPAVLPGARRSRRSSAALAVPLGLAYGWFVRPRLDAVGPFWVAALALGFLALPRAHELDGFDDPMPDPHGASRHDIDPAHDPRGLRRRRSPIWPIRHLVVVLGRPPARLS